jgi:hypothetical protein
MIVTFLSSPVYGGGVTAGDGGGSSLLRACGAPLHHFVVPLPRMRGRKEMER